MPKEPPNPIQRFFRGLIKEAIKTTHKPKPLKKGRQPKVKDPSPKPKRLIPLSIRHQVLQRDRRQCVHCGRKPPQVTLEVDHIQPISKGGSNDISNLQTLCFDCNRGKSDRY
jgi:5-methylcytosine-specific restriction enzyme A